MTIAEQLRVLSVAGPSRFAARLVWPASVTACDLAFRRWDGYIEREQEARPGVRQRICDAVQAGRNIEMPRVYFVEAGGEIVMQFFDGRHRFCIQRDGGLLWTWLMSSDIGIELAVRCGAVCGPIKRNER